MFPKFYWGITGRGDYSFIPRDQPIMVSAMSLWNHKSRPPRHWPDWALDSGGFQAHLARGDYPFSPDDYLQAVQMWRPTWAAALDYPCEPELCEHMTLNERIDATVGWATYLCKRSERIVPVLQGYSLEAYEDCWRRLPKTGRVAIGTLCRRQSLAEIGSLVNGLSEFVTAPWRHGFGIKLLALRRPEVRTFFTSVDSNAWEFAVMVERHRLKHLPFRARLEWAFTRYAQMVHKLEFRPHQLCLESRQRSVVLSEGES
jgi:hypothetical protein